jgi:hypothetical protein
VQGGGSRWEVQGQYDIAIDYGLHTINELNNHNRNPSEIG